MIVAQRREDPAQGIVRHDLEAEIAEMVGERENTLASVEGALCIAHLPKSCGHIDESPSQPMLIAQGIGEQFGFAQGCKDLLHFCKWNKRNAEVKVQIDSLLVSLTTVREMCEGPQRLLKVRHRLPIGRACQR